jgi:hypothetical protein
MGHPLLIPRSGQRVSALCIRGSLMLAKRFSAYCMSRKSEEFSAQS